MKRGYLQTTIIILLSVQLTIAQDYLLERSIDSISRAIASIFAPIFGTGYGDFLFAKILLFFLLFAVIHTSLKRSDVFAGNQGVIIIITSITSILAVRYLRPTELINAILLPYSALGISISVFIPLIIFFYFVRTSGMGSFARRAAWFMYLVIFTLLWGSKEYDPVGVAGGSLGIGNWMYIIGFAFLLINLVFDRSLQRYFGLSGLTKWRDKVEDRIIAGLQAELQEIARVNSPQATRRRIAINRELNRLTRG